MHTHDAAPDVLPFPGTAAESAPLLPPEIAALLDAAFGAAFLFLRPALALAMAALLLGALAASVGAATGLAWDVLHVALTAAWWTFLAVTGISFAIEGVRAVLDRWGALLPGRF